MLLKKRFGQPVQPLGFLGFIRNRRILHTHATHITRWLTLRFLCRGSSICLGGQPKRLLTSSADFTISQSISGGQRLPFNNAAGDWVRHALEQINLWLLVYSASGACISTSCACIWLGCKRFLSVYRCERAKGILVLSRVDELGRHIGRLFAEIAALRVNLEEKDRAVHQDQNNICRAEWVRVQARPFKHLIQLHEVSQSFKQHNYEVGCVYKDEK